MPILTLSAYSNEEVALKIKNSEIIGLPEKYDHSMILWSENSILIKNKKLKLPNIFSEFLESDKTYHKDSNLFLQPNIAWELALRAAWSNRSSEDSGLPDYMIFSFRPISKDFRIELIINMESVSIVGSRIILTAYSKEKGDVWVNDKKQILKSVVSTELELVIDGSASSVWEKYHN